MAKAKSELLSAIQKCPDDAKINVYAFNSGYRPFQSSAFALDVNSRVL